MKGLRDWRNAVIYHILIDRFAGYDSRKNDGRPQWVGGNLKGITKKLPYLKTLGVNVIWLSPFYKGAAYHGYHVTDFYEVDPHFGTKNDLKKMIKTCHHLRMKVIVDYIPNHVSFQHPFFQNAQKNEKSVYRNWFVFTHWPDLYLSFLQVKELPKLNLENKETREYIIQNALYWFEEFGIDGMRLDHAIGPSHDFWMEFRKRIKTKRKDALLLGEVWFQGVKTQDFKALNMKGLGRIWHFGRSHGIDRRQDAAVKSYVGILDGCLDFTFNRLIKEWLVKRHVSENVFLKKLKQHYKRFPKHFLLPAFLDNHDMNRFLFETGGNKEKLRKGAQTQFSVSQPKIIYYGTEIGMSHKKDIKKIKSHGDLQARKKMIWDSSRQDKYLFEFYRDLIRSH